MISNTLQISFIQNISLYTPFSCHFLFSLVKRERSIDMLQMTDINHGYVIYVQVELGFPSFLLR